MISQNMSQHPDTAEKNTAESQTQIIAIVIIKCMTSFLLSHTWLFPACPKTCRKVCVCIGGLQKRLKSLIKGKHTEFYEKQKNSKDRVLMEMWKERWKARGVSGLGAWDSNLEERWEMRQAKDELTNPRLLSQRVLEKSKSRFTPEARKLFYNNEPHSHSARKWHLWKYWQDTHTLQNESVRHCLNSDGQISSSWPQNK